MTEICRYNECTGCGACANRCPVKCITMKADDYGELHPIVNHDVCIDCGMCVSHCPNNVPLKFHQPQKVYAAAKKDKGSLARCAAGGVATSLAEYGFNNGYSVWACLLDKQEEKLVCRHKLLQSKKDVEDSKGSKYVQSDVGTTYTEIEGQLKAGKKCIFIGTPCQCAGLYAFLKDVSYENLITIDLVCHGVCPQQYLDEELQYISKGKRIDNVTFRGWDVKEDHHFLLWKENSIVFNRPGVLSWYVKGYSDGVILRESCYVCRYAQSNRISDITLGDFHGLVQSGHKRFKENCVNVVLINTDAGNRLFSFVRNEFDMEERSLEEAVCGNRCLHDAWARNRKQKQFRSNVKNNNFSIAIRKTIKKEMLIAYIHKIVKYVQIRLKRGKVQ